MTTPYVPSIPQSPMRALYRSVVQVVRLAPAFLDTGAMSVSWGVVEDIVDIYLQVPGQMQCRFDLGFVRPGKDQPAPMVAGRAPDRFGVCFYDPVTDTSGRPLVRAGDRLVCIVGPIFGTFEIRLVPDVAQDYLGAHHVEVQVIEVSQALEATSVTPFPGVQP